MPRPPVIRYTWTDYLSTPEDTSRRHEIVDGELFETALLRDVLAWTVSGQRFEISLQDVFRS